jgi:AcrR family transcriptional regulator
VHSCGVSAKGSATRQSIVARGFELAGQLGPEGLTIGQLAEQLELSKSGLYAPLKSKEALQIGVVEHAVAQFVDQVVRPALLTPRGEPRVRAMFAAWLDWGLGQPSGIVLATAHHHRLLAHPRAHALALSSFEDLVAAARARYA